MKIHITKHLDSSPHRCKWIGTHLFLKQDKASIWFIRNGEEEQLRIADFEYTIEYDNLQDMPKSVDPVDYSKYKI